MSRIRNTACCQEKKTIKRSSSEKLTGSLDDAQSSWAGAKSKERALDRWCALGPASSSTRTSCHAVGGVRPVGGGNGGLVLLGGRLVEHRQQFVGLVGQRLQVDDSVRPVAVVRVQDQVTVEISGKRGTFMAHPNKLLKYVFTP